jgi:hypothetical protein
VPTSASSPSLSGAPSSTCLLPATQQEYGAARTPLVLSLKEAFIDDTQTVHVLRSRTACLGTTLLLPQLTYQVTQRTRADNLHPNGIRTQRLGLLCYLWRSQYANVPQPPSFESNSTWTFLLLQILIVACSHKPRLQAHSSALTSSVRVIKFSTNLRRIMA